MNSALNCPSDTWLQGQCGYRSDGYMSQRGTVVQGARTSLLLTGEMLYYAVLRRHVFLVLTSWTIVHCWSCGMYIVAITSKPTLAKYLRGWIHWHATCCLHLYTSTTHWATALWALTYLFELDTCTYLSRQQTLRPRPPASLRITQFITQVGAIRVWTTPTTYYAKTALTAYWNIWIAGSRWFLEASLDSVLWVCPAT